MRFKAKFDSTASLVIVIWTLIVHLHVCNGQENVQTRIPSSLTECYMNTDILQRDNRLPLNINMLIELIRKVEDTPGYNQDIRTLSTSLVHRFRLDGIERAPGVFASRAVLPYSPSAYQFFKHKLLLSRLVPGTAVQFPNNTLTSFERCALHFMLSSSIETQVRGDEATRCGQLSQFRAMRISSKVDNSRRKRSIKNLDADIELMDGLKQYRHRRRMLKNHGRFEAINEGNAEEDDTNDDEEGPVTETPAADGAETDYHDYDPTRSAGDAGLVDVASTSISQCPVENGVIRTTWGTVAVGPLITGIAAGIVQQSVTTRELIQLTRAHGDGLYQGGQQQTPLSVDNRWASTLAGDLAEVALIQGPLTNDITVGSAGAWNSSQVPRWYFLSQRERLEMTDAEIRGGIDGLVLGTNVQDWRNQATQLKLSQLLDMYYSQRGVFSTDIRSCNRKELFTRVANTAQLQAQTIAFSTVLDKEMQLRVTLNPQAIQQFSTSAVQALTNYVSNNLNDVTCAATAELSQGNSTVQIATDLYIFVDFSWQYHEIQPIVATLIENLNVNRFGSRITLLNANDGGILVNTTSTLSEFYVQWNTSTHQLQTPGLNLPNVLRQLRTTGQNQLDWERATSAVTRRSFVSLIIPQMTGVSEADANFGVEQVNIIREQIPDLQLLFFTAGSPTRFERFVRDSKRDLFPLQPLSSSATESVQQFNSFVQPVVRRIEQLPRAILNHRCGSNWSQNDWGTNTADQYVEPLSINYYRVHPNYFFLPGADRRVKIQNQGYSQVSVCSSRWTEQPRFSNVTGGNENVECRQLKGNDVYEIDLSNACEGQFLIKNCQPLFISVEGLSLAGVANYRCSDVNCRFPDSIRFGVAAANLGCFSGASTATISAFAIILSITAFIINIKNIT